jgi:hypothetical protein
MDPEEYKIFLRNPHAYLGLDADEDFTIELCDKHALLNGGEGGMSNHDDNDAKCVGRGDSDEYDDDDDDEPKQDALGDDVSSVTHETSAGGGGRGGSSTGDDERSSNSTSGTNLGVAVSSPPRVVANAPNLARRLSNMLPVRLRGQQRRVAPTIFGVAQLSREQEPPRHGENDESDRGGDVDENEEEAAALALLEDVDSIGSPSLDSHSVCRHGTESSNSSSDDDCSSYDGSDSSYDDGDDDDDSSSTGGSSAGEPTDLDDSNEEGAAASNERTMQPGRTQQQQQHRLTLRSGRQC